MSVDFSAINWLAVAAAVVLAVVVWVLVQAIGADTAGEGLALAPSRAAVSSRPAQRPTTRSRGGPRASL